MTVKPEMIIYFSAVCGALAIIAPILSSTVTRFVFGTVLGTVAITSWPAIKAVLG